MKKRFIILTSLFILGISGCGKTDSDSIQNVEVEATEVGTDTSNENTLGEIQSKVNGDWQSYDTSFSKEALDEIEQDKALVETVETLQSFMKNELKFDYDKSYEVIMNDYYLSGNLEDMKKQYAEFWTSYCAAALEEESVESVAEKTDVSYKIVSDKGVYDIVLRYEYKEPWFVYPFDVVLKKVENKWRACLECDNGEGKSFYYQPDGVVQLNVKTLVEEGEKKFYVVGDNGEVSLAYTLSKLGIYKKDTEDVYIYEYSEDADAQIYRFFMDGEEYYMCDEGLNEIIVELTENPVFKSQKEISDMILKCYEKHGLPPISD